MEIKQLTNNQETTSAGFNIVIGIVCVVTNISQLPYFVSLGISSLVATMTWVVFAIYLIFSHKMVLQTNVFPVVFFTLFLLFYALIMKAITGIDYVNTSLLSAIFTAIFVLIVSYIAGQRVNNKTLSVFSTCYILSAAFVGTFVFFQFLFEYDVSSRVYAYTSKNSITQIIYSALIFILVYKMNIKQVAIKIVYIILLLFLLYIILLLKSRASLISIPIILLIVVWMGKLNKKAAIAVSVGLIAAVIILILKPSIWDSMYKNILMGGRSDELSDLTSGRSTEWENFPLEFSNSPIFGHGVMKRESLILTSLLEYGILGGIPILVFALSPLLFVMPKLDLRQIEVQAFLLVVVAYLINGIFEQLAPFGPGVKCYALWFMMGVFMANSKYNRKRDKRGLWKTGLSG